MIIERALALAAMAAGLHAQGDCRECHADIVDEYARHGMSDSIGAGVEALEGEIAHPVSGRRYRIWSDERGSWLDTLGADGGLRRQRLVGRIGAGVFDISWITTEVLPELEEAWSTPRIFFAPVEHVTGEGLQLSPFERFGHGVGPDFALTPECLQCHTQGRLPDTYPRHAVGADVVAGLPALGCASCHGEMEPHGDGKGVLRLSSLPAAEQRDRCARCHLDGEARIDLPGQRPVLVSSTPTDDFRFVGQLERLALSECFQASPQMTCTTCHLPHSGARAQGRQSFDARCQSCHASCPSVSEPDEGGCVECHVRQSQPFDVAGIVTADHFIRRRIPAPASVPPRPHADALGGLKVFDDGRMAAVLATPEGRRWQDGLIAMGLSKLHRMDEAAELFATFPAPGTPSARVPSGPASLASLETSGVFHFTRALTLEATGAPDAAELAYADALAVDPGAAEARINRATLRLNRGDIPGALGDAQAVLDRFPLSDMAWNIRARAAVQAGDHAAAAAALANSTRIWPSSAATWGELGHLLRGLGRADDAEAAESVARRLQPSR